MKPLGAARRGDVVLVQMPEAMDPRRIEAVAEQVQAVYAETGVAVIILPHDMCPVALVPMRRPRARSGPTPRWCRS